MGACKGICKIYCKMAPDLHEYYYFDETLAHFFGKLDVKLKRFD